MQRRAFLKASCSFCLLAAAGSILPALAASKNKVFKTALNENSQAEIPLSLFEESTLQFVRIKGSYYDIALHKEEDGSYMALLMKCTHMDNQLSVTGEGFRCSQHGSEFDKTGVVTKGPAEASLITYPTTVNETSILITILNNEE